MTKLMQWLLILAIYGVFYVTALTETLPLNLTENGKLFVAVVSLIIYFFNYYNFFYNLSIFASDTSFCDVIYIQFLKNKAQNPESLSWFFF